LGDEWISWYCDTGQRQQRRRLGVGVARKLRQSARESKREKEREREGESEDNGEWKMDAVARQGRSGQSWAELDDVTELDVRKGEKPGQRRRRRRRRRQGPSESESGQLARGNLCVCERERQGIDS
jgi:hypothetical protein